MQAVIPIHGVIFFLDDAKLLQVYITPVWDTLHKFIKRHGVFLLVQIDSAFEISQLLSCPVSQFDLSKSNCTLVA